MKKGTVECLVKGCDCNEFLDEAIKRENIQGSDACHIPPLKGQERPWRPGESAAGEPQEG